jgi:hypothetical protein
MSNKFLSSGGDINLSNGSQTLFGSTIGAVNLNPSAPLKTNSVRELVSEKLDIGDVNNLTDDLKIKQNLSFVKNDSQTNPDSNQIKIYAKTDGNLYKRDSAGTETAIGGGGGGLDYTQGSTIVENGLIFTDGVSNTDVKNVAGFRLDTINNTLVVNDIETANQLSVDTTLTNISYNPSNQITSIEGELDVDKIKNTAHTAEIEFENTGLLNLVCDDAINITSNANNLNLNGSLINALTDIKMGSNEIKGNSSGKIAFDAQDFLEMNAVTYKLKNTISNAHWIYITNSVPNSAINFIEPNGTYDGSLTNEGNSMKVYSPNGNVILDSQLGNIKFDLRSGDQYAVFLNDKLKIYENIGNAYFDMIGGGNIIFTQNGHPLATKTTGFSNEELVPKSYVDTQIATISLTDLETKTQNIDLTETDATKTRMTQPLEIGNLEFLTSWRQYGNFGDITLVEPITAGWEFNFTQNGTITRFKLRKDLVAGHRTIYFDSINKETNSALPGQQSFTTNQDDGTYYYYDLPTPIQVAPGPNNLRYLVSVFLPIGDKLSRTTTPNDEILTGVFSRFNSNTSAWTYPNTLQDPDDCNIINFNFKPINDVGNLKLKAFNSYTQNCYVNNRVIVEKNKYGFTDNNELVSKSYVDTHTKDLFVAATDEVNSITTTGEKMRIYAPYNVIIKKIKVMINSAGGANFQTLIKRNGTTIHTANFGATDTIITYLFQYPLEIGENDIISIEVGNSGGNTASGLKFYLGCN